MPLNTLDFLNGAWLVVLFCTLGLAPATLAVRSLRLPPYFWPPLVIVCAGLVGYALFWCFFFWPMPARDVSRGVTIVAAGAFAWLLTRRDVRALLGARDAWLPTLLFALVLTAGLGYLLWSGVPSTHRFTLPMPPEDHFFPLYFANRLFNGLYTTQAPQAFTTLLVETHSSDRPPLQASIVLAVRSMGLGSGQYTVSPWTYQVLASACQAGWVLGVYALGRALDLNRRQLWFVLIGSVTSWYFLLGVVYPVPKLFAGWLFLVSLALGVYLIRRPGVERGVPIAIAAAAVMAVSFLAHGGTFFSILALPVLLLHRDTRRALRPAHMAAGVMVAVLLLSPWLAYQRFYDPPGNRLPKWHLAGIEEIDDRSTWEAIRDVYGAITFRQYLEGRWQNVKEQGIVLGVAASDHPIDWIQWQQFFHTGPALDFLLVGFAALFSRRLRVSEARPEALGLTHVTVYALLAVLVWIVVVFKPGTALLHYGSYGTTALLIVCAAAWLALLPPWIRRAALALHIALFAGAWLVLRLPLWPADGPPAKTCVQAAVIMAVAFVAFAAALRFLPDDPPQPVAEQSRAA